MKIALYLFPVIVILSLAACSPPDGKPSGQTGTYADSIAGAGVKNAIDAASGNASDTVSYDQNHLVGDWERTDGEYTLRIYSASADGKLDATYFNPESIHVARAEWSAKDGYYIVVVELQDVNYPGSTYTLAYTPDGDRLTGNYFQAVEKVNYEVGFARKK
ncbi:MAG: hypothetical protein AB9834_21620 [Lentimicrobium sp.]